MAALWMAHRRGGEARWVLAAAVLANLLCAPYVQSYDLSLAAIALVLAVSSFSAIPEWKRAAAMLLAFVPGFLAVVGQVTGRNWPVVPLVLAALFVVCLRKARAPGVRTQARVAPAPSVT
jgi:hypothetical protein